MNRKFNTKEKIGRKVAKCLTIISPTLSSKFIYFVHTHKKLNLNNPTLFNEKLMYLKLHDYKNNQLVSDCSDKIKVREYLQEKNLDFLLTNVYQIVEDANLIDFDALPDKFVLKCNHGCGFNIICTDKANFDKKAAIKQLNEWKKTKYGYESCEIHYFSIKPLIFAEEYIASDEGIMPNDYKIYCFNGKARIILVCSEREESLKLTFFDINWNELNYGTEAFKATKPVKKPKHLNKMLEYAEKLAQPFKFVRVDFYEEEDKILFGELTFTPARCSAEYYNNLGNKELGQMLDLGDI